MYCRDFSHRNDRSDLRKYFSSHNIGSYQGTFELMSFLGTIVNSFALSYRIVIPSSINNIICMIFLRISYMVITNIAGAVIFGRFMAVTRILFNIVVGLPVLEFAIMGIIFFYTYVIMGLLWKLWLYCFFPVAAKLSISCPYHTFLTISI